MHASVSAARASAIVKITDVEPIVLRLAQVDTTRADGTQDAFLVRIHTDEGIVGVGEADTAPMLARAMIEMPSSHAVAQGLREVLVGEDPLQIDRLWQRLFHASDHYGRRGAALHVISAIDIALWDIAGKVAGRPVCELLGGRRLDRIPVYASEVMPETPDARAGDRRGGGGSRVHGAQARLGAARQGPRSSTRSSSARPARPSARTEP